MGELHPGRITDRLRIEFDIPAATIAALQARTGEDGEEEVEEEVGNDIGFGTWGNGFKGNLRGLG